MKKLATLFAFTPFLFAFQCDSESESCGTFFEFEKSNLVTIENPQETYAVGDVLWLSSTVDRHQINSNTGNSIDLFESDDNLSYSIEIKKASIYNGFDPIFLNENTTIVEVGAIDYNTIILVKDGEQFKSRIGIKLLEPGSFNIYLYNVSSFDPLQIGCNYTHYSMVTDFSGLNSRAFAFIVE
jgi:hypothetical protein